MAINLFTFVDLYGRALDTASHLLTRGREHASRHGVDEAALLEWRLIEDMQPFCFQLMVVVNFAQQWPARVAGLTVPEAIGSELSADEFQAAIASAKAFLSTLTPGSFDGRGETPLSYSIGPSMEPTLPAERWLTVFATTNLYFHLSTAYGILRSRGVHLSKPDLFASGL